MTPFIGELIGTAFRHTPFLADTPAQGLDVIANYPISTSCTQAMGTASTGSERRKEERP